MTSEHASVIDWPVRWDIGAPMPFVISSGSRTFVVYYATPNMPPADPEIVKIIGDIKPESPVALLEFLGCIDARFGGPGEDDIAGTASIPGLTPHKAHLVQNSAWVEWLKQVNDGSRESDRLDWLRYKHFVLGFHDERFECIAKSYFIEVYGFDYDDVVQIALDRIVGTEWWIQGTNTRLTCPKCNKYLGKHFYDHFCSNCGTALR